MKPMSIVTQYALRKTAEEKVCQTQNRGDDALQGELNAQKLLHELQVHQVELEMQNTELLHSQRELESLLSQYTLLYDFAPVGYVTLDRSGDILKCNLVAATLVGAVRSQLTGKPFCTFVATEDHLTLREFTRKVFLKQAERQECEVCLAILNHPPLYVQLEGRANGSEMECLLIMTDVTALRLEEQKFRIVAENTADWEFWITPTGDFVYNSPACWKITGHNPEAFFTVPSLMMEIIHPEDRELFALHRHEYAEQGVGAEIDIRIIRADGEIRWINHVCNPVYDKTQLFIGTRGSNRDITERKRIEWQVAGLAKLKEQLIAPLRLAEKLKRITDGIVEFFDADFTRIWHIRECDVREHDCLHGCDNKPTELCQQSGECLHLMASSGRYRHLDGAHRRVPFGQYKIGKIASGEELRFMTNDVANDPRIHNHGWARKLGLVSFAGFRIVAEDGTPMGVLALFSKKPIQTVEMELLADLANFTSHVIITSLNHAILREREAKFRALFENANDAILIMDNSTFIDCNVKATEIFHCSREQIVGVEPYRLSPELQPGGLNSTDEALVHINLALTGQAQFYEWTHLHYDGTPFDAEVSLNVIEFGGGKRIQAIIRNVSERKHIERELLHTTLAAEAANIAKGQFIANMSHEIRTPMNGVIGMTSLLMNTNLDETQREYVATIRSSGKTLLNLINDILDIAKIEAHKMELESSLFDVHSLLRDTFTQFSVAAGEKGLELLIESDPAVPHLLKGDMWRLRQVVTNLVGNAIKFTAAGHVRLQLQTTVANGSEVMLHFTVGDSGIGISHENIQHIFKPFVQADGSTTRQFGGTGLGLAICKQLVGLMGGTISVSSTEGKGSEFCFSVRVDTPTVEEVRLFNDIECSKLPSQQDTLTPTASFKLLLAEDDAVNQKVARALLSQLGHAVTVVENGTEAITALKEHDYDLVLMDCMMPVMGGFEATAVIRDPHSAVRNHQIPVIALTADAFQSDREKCLAAGMTDYLTKPYEIDELRHMIDKWLTTEAPGEVTLRDGELFHRDILLKRSLNDRTLADEVAHLFMACCKPTVDAIKGAIVRGDLEELGQKAHKLKGSASCVALPLLSQTAGEMEKRATTGSPHSAAELLPLLEQHLELSLAALREFLNLPGV